MTKRFGWLLFLACSVFATIAMAAPSPSDSARSGKLLLVPAGRVAKWPVYLARGEPDDYSLYHYGRRRSSPLEGVFTSAHGKPWTIPTRIQNGMPDPRSGVVSWLPVVRKQIFIPALGRKVVFYQSEVGGGADNDTYSTEPIPWPDGEGGTVYLRISAEVAETKPERLLIAVRWASRSEVAHWRVRR